MGYATDRPTILHIFIPITIGDIWWKYTIRKCVTGLDECEKYQYKEARTDLYARTVGYGKEMDRG
jgi:hypothetical protein